MDSFTVLTSLIDSMSVQEKLSLLGYTAISLYGSIRNSPVESLSYFERDCLRIIDHIQNDVDFMQDVLKFKEGYEF